LKKFDEAESTAKKMIKKHPKEYQYTITLASVYNQQGERDKGNELFDDLIKGMPADPNEIANLANKIYNGGNIDYAIKAFQQGLKLMHNDNLFSYELITLYRAKRDKVNLAEQY